MYYEMRVPTTEAEAVEILKSAVLVIFGHEMSGATERIDAASKAMGEVCDELRKRNP